MPILNNGYSLLSSGMVKEPNFALRSPLVRDGLNMQTPQVVTLYLFEMTRKPSMEISFFASVLPLFREVGVSKRRTPS
jgi:hypothetical protein